MTTIADIKRANKAAGFHFFDADTMRFFASRVHRRTFGPYFVTSEKACFDDYRRVFTVRRAEPGGDIETIGKVGQYRTLEAANLAAHAAHLATKAA